MAPEVKTAKNSKLPKLPENCFEPVGKGGWPPISTWITFFLVVGLSFTTHDQKLLVTPCPLAKGDQSFPAIMQGMTRFVTPYLGLI
jgi:hypothetical protein